MTVVHQAANPLPFLLAEEAHGDHQATDAVFLTFNSDLGFFEARILGACLSAGARVCIVADGSVWNPDPYAIKNAGRDYHVGLAIRSGAFHPKLAVLAGPKRAVVAVGSGNLTLGGWQHNAETWTILQGDTDRAPAALAGIADALSDQAQGGLDTLAAAALLRAADELRGLLAQCANVVDTGHRILSSTTSPIIDQMPTTKVDRLWLYAPFHDESARGVAAVLERLQPTRVTIMVQPNWTVINPSALERVLRAHRIDWEIVEDAETNGGARARYRHGKLIEWTTLDGQRFALTGSPNLSYAALCAPPGTGNTELAVLSRLQDTLFPPSASLAIAEVPHVRLPTSEEHAASARPSVPVLLSAVLAHDALALTLNRPLTAPGALELSLRGDSPDMWSKLAEVPPGTVTPSLLLMDPVPANSRVRLRVPHVEGSDDVGALVFVTDAVSVGRRRIVGMTSRTTRNTSADLFSDDLAVIAAFAIDLAELASDVSASRPPRMNVESDQDAGQREPARDTDASDWLWLQDQTTAHHGPHLAAFGLGMPAPPPFKQSERFDWEDTLVADSEAELVDDTAEAVDADDELSDPEPVTLPDHSQDHADIRRARRRRISNWAQMINAVPVSSSLIVLRLTLVWWSAGDWDASDPEPHRIVAKMLREVARRDTGGQIEADARIASLGVVALTLLRDRIDTSRRDENTMRFLQLRDDLSYLVLDVREDLVTAYSALLRRPSGTPLEPQHVMDNVDEWQRQDPYGDAVTVMEEAGHTVSRPGPRLLLISGAFSSPERVALAAAAQVPDRALPVGVWAVSDGGRWAFVIWDRPDLVKAVNAGTGLTRWRHQRLGPLLGPSTSMESGSHAGLVRHGPLIEEPQIAHELMAGLGVTSAHPPDGERVGTGVAPAVLT